MSTTTPALIVAAAGVGFGHAILPDHWLPLAVVGRTRNYPLSRVARISGLAGLAHVLVSIVLGGIIIVVGLQFRSIVQSAQEDIVGAILILTGIAFAALELAGHSHHHDHEHHHAHPHPHSYPKSAAGEQARGLAAIMVPFGAAASPDLTILPVFLAATSVGAGTAIGSVLVFAAVTVGTIVGLTLLSCFSGHQMGSRWLERWGNVITALVLLVIGALVLTAVI